MADIEVERVANDERRGICGVEAAE